MYTTSIDVPEALQTAPAVLLNAFAKRASPLASVVPDELGAGRTVARVLLDAGHRDGIHLIGAGPTERDVPAGGAAAFERITGIRDVLGEAGVEVASGHLCAEWLPDEGFAATRAVLAHDRPRALVCLNDRLALGAYQALEDAGLKVPADVSVASFDDDAIASWMRPRLTTVALPHYELGRTAVGALFDAIEQRREGRPGPGAVHRVRMPLRRRESVAPPAG
jgi:LacI family transcriptional regulator